MSVLDVAAKQATAATAAAEGYRAPAEQPSVAVAAAAAPAATSTAPAPAASDDGSQPPVTQAAAAPAAGAATQGGFPGGNTVYNWSYGLQSAYPALYAEAEVGRD